MLSRTCLFVLEVEDSCETRVKFRMAVCLLAAYDIPAGHATIWIFAACNFVSKLGLKIVNSKILKVERFISKILIM